MNTIQMEEDSKSNDKASNCGMSSKATQQLKTQRKGLNVVIGKKLLIVYVIGCHPNPHGWATNDRDLIDNWRGASPISNCYPNRSRGKGARTTARNLFLLA
eukprot:531917_1